VKELLIWRPDIAIAFCSAGPSYYEKSLCLCLAKVAGARTFLSPRSGYQVSWLEGSWLARRWLVASQRFIDGFLMQSRSWRDFHVRFGIRAEKTYVWFNAIDLEAWAPIAEGRREAGQGRPFRFLFLAWAIAEKGLPELIEATEALNARDGPPFEVAVAGDGLFGRELIRRQEKGTVPKNVHLLGWVLGDQRTAELRAADALVLPTWFEGFPNVILEAMACALPVISTPVGAIEEVVEDGRTGLLVPVRSPFRLADAMDRLRRDPSMAHAMGLRGRELVRERFDCHQAVERFAEIIEIR
jgi:glycosyltransferase involved in cell wall biosynthesis